MTRLVSVVVILCLLTAGCSNFDDSVESTSIPANETDQTPSPTNLTSETNDGLPFDEEQTLERVRSLVGENVSAPRIRTEEIEPRPAIRTNSSDKFNALMNMSIRYPPIDDTAGGTRANRVEISYTSNATASEIEQVLAHELVHVAQPTDLRRNMTERADPTHAYTTDAEMARTSVIEGTAIYVEDRYTAEYLRGVKQTSTLFEQNWEGWSTGLRLYWAPYYFGSEYVSKRVDSPRKLESIYRNAPTTTEQVLHGYRPEEEPVSELSVASMDENSSWDATVTDTKGELYIRLVLANELPESQARAAASGWGYDRAVTYYNGSRAGHAWVLSWDDSASTEQFESAFSRYLDSRADRMGETWHSSAGDFRLQMVDDETVVVFFGDHSFVSNASIDASGETVTVIPG